MGVFYEQNIVHSMSVTLYKLGELIQIQ